MAVEYWPRGLHDFGVEPLAMIDLLTARDFRFFDLNAPLSMDLPEADRDWLRETYRVRNRRFTNLLTVRSRIAALGPSAPGFPRRRHQPPDQERDQRQVEPERPL